MKRILLVAVLCFVPQLASAQLLDCGQISNSNNSFQAGNTRAVESFIATTRQVTACPIWLQTEGWVSGSPTGARVQPGSVGQYTVELRMTSVVPSFQTYQTVGKHWWVFVGWNFNGHSFSYADVRAPTVRGEGECAALGGIWDGWRCNLTNCPLIIDVKKNGYRLTTAANGVLFDMDNDGQLDQTAWTEADSDDAFAFFDRNNNRLPNPGELLGDAMPAYATSAVPTAANGFEALKFLERPEYGISQAGDGLFDSRDAAYSKMYLWQDANHNGIGDPGEITSWADAGLLAIEMDYKASRKQDPSGNYFKQRAKAYWRKGTYYVYDVWLQYER
jgi:hypothetical protein